MKKRIASVLVALVMVLSLVPKTSWAWTSTVTTLEQLKSAMSELSRSEEHTSELQSH